MEGAEIEGIPARIGRVQIPRDMVSSMAYDRGGLPRVAWLALFLVIGACGPVVKPPSPPPEPGPIGKVGPTPIRGGGRQVMVGEMCPQGAAGRPAVAPLVMRSVQWTDNAGEVAAAVERGSVPRFVVLGVDGKLAGMFDTLGLVDIAPNQSVASGTYAGASPCTYAAAAKAGSGPVATRGEDPKCGQATGGCGLAIGELSHPDEPPETSTYATGGACLSGDELAVDIDGDGRLEQFPLATVLDGIRGPAAEWSAAPTANATCTPAFHLYDVKLVPEAEAGKPSDAKGTVVLDVLGVVDLDGDGRKELVLALKFPTVRSIVVYSAIESPLRLTLVGEAVSFSR
jgi:hypothetical protein